MIYCVSGSTHLFVSQIPETVAIDVLPVGLELLLVYIITHALVVCGSMYVLVKLASKST